jgi:phosphoribosylanthranilate isomerase
VTGPRVKICGLTRLEDAELAVRLGADALGFVLWPRSPRFISARDVAVIVRQLPAFVTRVGVVVNMPPAEAAAAIRTAGLDVLQLHGDESAAAYQAAAGRIVKAMPAATDEDVAVALNLPPEVTVLVDAADSARGGTGRKADWQRAAFIARRRPLILAGGLTPDNVADAMASVKPWAVDVSSGVEEAPGVKSARRMEAFFEVIHQVRIQNSEFGIGPEVL